MPDFSVKNLADYEEMDLNDLLMAVNECKNTMAERHEKYKYSQPNIASSFMDIKNSLDIWAYRIKDAIKEAKKRD